MRVNNFIYLFKENKCLFWFDGINMGVSESKRPLGLFIIKAKNYPKNITSSRVPTCQHMGNFSNNLRSKSHQERKKLGQCNSSNERQIFPLMGASTTQEYTMAANGNTEKKLEIPQNWADLNQNTLKSAYSHLPLHCLQKLFSLSNREILCI